MFKKVHPAGVIWQSRPHLDLALGLQRRWELAHLEAELGGWGDVADEALKGVGGFVAEEQGQLALGALEGGLHPHLAAGRQVRSQRVCAIWRPSCGLTDTAMGAVARASSAQWQQGMVAALHETLLSVGRAGLRSSWMCTANIYQTRPGDGCRQ